MPRIYTQHAEPAMSDADDSIVLDDLVRTGEASRLRRRGAMRLDHGHATHHGGGGGGAAAAAADSDEESEEQMMYTPTMPGPVPRRTPTRARTSRRHDEHAETPTTPTCYTLFCGGDDPEPPYHPEVGSAPFRPSLLPLSAPSPSTSAPSKKRRTNGCGALIHVSASPRRRPASTAPAGFTWHAASPAEVRIAPLDACYFDEPTRLRIQRSPCGCVREGIACATCGNPLGTRYAPCAASAPSHAPLPHPSRRPSYPAGIRPAVPLFSYSFLPSAVTSSPAYTPPSRTDTPTTTPDPSSAQEPPNSLMDPPTYPPLLDRLITACPTPLSDEEREAYRARAPPAAMPRYSYGYPYSHSYSSYTSYTPYPYGPGPVGYVSAYGGGYPGGYGAYGAGGVYDADGELVSLDSSANNSNPAEPGSPKAGETLLLPER
ncbi:hypothetical protein H0H87_006747 [Tephrocybe sp. NHM501043]|nr:hypothetical protein H0H87_006747 [Tephrocybe sp. NHM501043]